MADGRRWSVSYTRRFTAIALTACAFFVMCAGFGLSNWAVVALGVALLVLAVSILVVTIVRGNARNFVRGTAHVLAVSEAPASVSVGRCELQIVVEASGLSSVTVKIRDTRVPVDKWPDVGATLPIRVAVGDPRQVRVLWDEVRSHSEVAAEEVRFNEYVQRIVDAELGPEHDDEPEFEAYPQLEAAPQLEAEPELVAEPDPPPAPPTVLPRPRPSPRQRRSSAATGRATAVAVATAAVAVADQAGPTTRAAALVEETDEMPIIDIVPIEGASAVLGVRPTRDPVVDTPPEEARPTADSADAAAVADLLAAYPSARPGATNSIHGVGVTLFVTDLPRSLAFYRDLLGFLAVDSGPTSAVLASGETRISLRRVSDMAPVDRRLVQLNLEVGDVEAVYEELRGKGVKFIHRPRPVARGDQMELWAAAFRDPDGHGIAIIRWQRRD